MTRCASICGRTVRLLTLAAATTLHAGDWPTYHGAFTLTGSVPDVLPAAPVRLWKSSVGRAVLNTPVSDGERIYALSDDGRLVALRLDGSRAWSRIITRPPDPDGKRAPETFAAPLLLARDTLVAGASSGLVYTFAAADGQPRWTYDVHGNIQGSATVVSPAGGTGAVHVVVMEQAAGRLHAIDLATGKRAWLSPPVARCDGSPAVADGNVVFGSCASALHVMAGDSGRQTATLALGEGREIAGGVAIHAGVAYAGNRNGELVAADLRNAAVLWRRSTDGGECFSTPAVTDKTVVFMAGDGVVYALERATGAIRWSFDTGGAAPNSPVISGADIIVSADGKLHLLDLATGAARWAFAVSDALSPPAVVKNRIVVGADDGTVCAFGAAE